MVEALHKKPFTALHQPISTDAPLRMMLNIPNLHFQKFKFLPIKYRVHREGQMISIEISAILNYQRPSWP